MICLTSKPSQRLFVYCIKSKENFFKEKEKWRIEPKKQKESFLTALAIVIKKDPTMSIRKCTYELKVCEKTVRTAIKQDLSPNHNPLDYAICGVLENITNATK